MQSVKRAEIEELFDRYAAAGHLTRHQMKLAMIALMGYKPSRFELDSMLKKAGVDPRAAQISRQTFHLVVRDRLSSRDPDDVIRQAFRTLDTQYVGFLTLQGIIPFFREVAPHISAETVRGAFNEVDTTGDGRITYSDFERMMKWKARP